METNPFNITPEKAEDILAQGFSERSLEQLKASREEGPADAPAMKLEAIPMEGFKVINANGGN